LRSPPFALNAWTHSRPRIDCGINSPSLYFFCPFVHLSLYTRWVPLVQRMSLFGLTALFSFLIPEHTPLPPPFPFFFCLIQNRDCGDFPLVLLSVSSIQMFSYYFWLGFFFLQHHRCARYFEGNSLPQDSIISFLELPTSSSPHNSGILLDLVTLSRNLCFRLPVTPARSFRVSPHLRDAGEMSFPSSQVTRVPPLPPTSRSSPFWTKLRAPA